LRNVEILPAFSEDRKCEVPSSLAPFARAFSVEQPVPFGLLFALHRTLSTSVVAISMVFRDIASFIA